MLEKLFEIISPDICVVCKNEGKCLCNNCMSQTLIYKKPACVFCNELNDTGKTCNRCYKKHPIRTAEISFRYEGALKELIWAMKYENKRSHARYFAGLLMPSSGIVCFVPSDGTARRKRGYDQAEILANNYAKLHKLEFKKLLSRQTHSRQVGKNRAERLKNTKGNFVVAQNVKGLDLLLIDDVITTGATISECASVLKAAGAKSVTALAIAKA
jgi:ComF family protein